MQSYLLRCSHGLSAYGKCQSRIHRIIVVCGRPDGWNMNFTIGDRSDGNVKLQDSQKPIRMLRLGLSTVGFGILSRPKRILSVQWEAVWTLSQLSCFLRPKYNT
jgi:hypothetical protein